MALQMNINQKVEWFVMHLTGGPDNHHITWSLVKVVSSITRAFVEIGNPQERLGQGHLTVSVKLPQLLWPIVYGDEQPVFSWCFR